MENSRHDKEKTFGDFTKLQLIYGQTKEGLTGREADNAMGPRHQVED